ncbi:MAG: pyruvate ferredoxin oxidoreductase [Acidobacteria bacterium]|nr:MAG: pyruvate ferredoxin oxidoreductase [Acidobacteriota bacterium]PIE90940.1 MAG: pyruvate ferredoxin oxidoreductase [Acidobacteriota bacterium]
MAKKKPRPKPHLEAQYCKGCGRCIEACPTGCISLGQEIHPETGLVPVVFTLEDCTACGLCFSACPEPFGISGEIVEADFELLDPEKMFGARESNAIEPVDIPDETIPVPSVQPLVIKGTYASAIGALFAGCRHFFGYPITPSTEGAELMAKILPKLDGVFLQAISEVATVNMMYGCGGAGLPCMTFTSSPGFSLMLEGVSYMIGAEVPGVFVNVMRGGPGLGNIAPEQADIKLVCRGLGHGNTHAIVLAPSTPQEMLDVTIQAFELSFKYRNPVIIISDGYLGQITGIVKVPDSMKKPGIPKWGVYGDAEHRANLITSIFLSEPDLEKHNIYLNEKYREIAANEQMVDLFECEDAEVLLVACNTPARMAKGAVEELRNQGIKAGLFRPVTVWPFPIDELKRLLPHIRDIVVVEASEGQLENEMRLALSKAGIQNIPEINHVRRYGGVLPQLEEIVEKVNTMVCVGAEG